MENYPHAKYAKSQNLKTLLGGFWTKYNLLEVSAALVLWSEDV